LSDKYSRPEIYFLLTKDAQLLRAVDGDKLEQARKIGWVVATDFYYECHSVNPPLRYCSFYYILISTAALDNRYVTADNDDTYP